MHPAALEAKRPSNVARRTRHAACESTETSAARKRVGRVIEMSMSYAIATRDGSRSTKTMDVVRVVLAVLFPPLGAFLRVGFSGHFFLNCLLTFFGYIPGLVHAVWLIAQGSDFRARIPGI